METKINRATQPLPILVQQKIIEFIRSGVFSSGSQLPIEPQLAKTLGVSRGTLREGIRLLEEDGLIYRRPGVGTFVRESLHRQYPLDKNLGAVQVMRSMGIELKHTEINITIISADSFVSELLHIEKGSSLIHLERVGKIKEKRVVYGVNIFPKAIVGKDKFNHFTGCLYEHLNEKYNQNIDYGIAKLIPVVASVDLSEKLKVAIGSPLLLIKQVNYDAENHPILFTREYWIKNNFEFTILRRGR